jgi:uridine kinase
MSQGGYVRNPFFWLGLGLRIFCILLLDPTIQTTWFVPFITSILDQPSLTPWGSFLARVNENAAFPYGPVMVLAHLPFVFVGWLAAQVTGQATLAAIGFKLSLLVADFGVFRVLSKMFPDREREILLFYWLSPIILFVTYIHGQTDVIPVFFFVVSLYFFQKEKFVDSGAALALAVLAKFSMLIVAPFFILYLFKSKKYKYAILPFLLSFIVPVILLNAPFLFDSGFRLMVLNTKEIERLYSLRVLFPGDISLYITPLLFVVLFYSIWRMPRMNFELLLAVIALGFFALILTGPAPPGWFVWLVPFLVIHQMRHGSAVVLVSVLGAAFVAYYAMTASGAAIPLFATSTDVAADFARGLFSQHQLSRLFTLLTGIGVVTAIQIARVGIRENDYYRLIKRPLAIGISGDSGSGKDTFAQAIIGLFGAHSTTHLSGDDYHIWDRHNPMWSAVTHLNPRANRLLEFTGDSLALIRRRGITGRHYDHTTGRFARLSFVQSNDIVILTGLHVLFLSSLREQLDIRFFLDMDEDLRRYFKLKRDSRERGHGRDKVLTMIHSRIDDAQRYVHPQRAFADTILSLVPINRELLDIDEDDIPPLKLRLTVRNGGYYEDLAKVLIGVCNLYISVETCEGIGSAVMEIESYADFKGEDAALAVQILCPRILELLDTKPKWLDGMTGVMQVVALTAINESLMSRNA